jgi:hypothetical protein
MQHLEASAQVAIKQRVLEDNLWHLGKIKPENLLRPSGRPQLGLPLSCPHVGAPCTQKRRSAHWFS